jgi:hypothetical protein
MKTVKKFLWDKNNNRELNIDKLCVVGEELGASIALNFAYLDAKDYEKGRQFHHRYKLGRFVKALVLISPSWSFRGLSVNDAMNDPYVQKDIALLFIVGKDNDNAVRDMKRLLSFVEQSHPEPKGDDKEKNLSEKTLFIAKRPTNLQGDKLLAPQFGVQSLLVEFISRRLIKSPESKEWTWKERKLPYLDDK